MKASKGSDWRGGRRREYSLNRVREIPPRMSKGMASCSWNDAKGERIVHEGREGGGDEYEQIMR